MYVEISGNQRSGLQQTLLVFYSISLLSPFRQNTSFIQVLIPLFMDSRDHFPLPELNSIWSEPFSMVSFPCQSMTQDWAGIAGMDNRCFRGVLENFPNCKEGTRLSGSFCWWTLLCWQNRNAVVTLLVANLRIRPMARKHNQRLIRKQSQNNNVSQL